MDQDFNDLNIEPIYEEIDNTDEKEELMAQKFYLYECLCNNEDEEAEEILDMMLE